MIGKLYNYGLWGYEKLMALASLFHPKAKLWYQGRKQFDDRIKNYDASTSTHRYWLHCASLGEFEQGRSVIEKIKEKDPKAVVILTFFSPSGYEVRKNYTLADVVCYLPLDRPKYVADFLDKIKPTAALFVKYEIWHNYFRMLHQRNIPLYMISVIFRADQRFFKSKNGNWFSKTLENVTHFFVQDENTKTLLNSIQLNNVTVCGDTRFDRVAEIAKNTKPVQDIATFIDNKTTVIFGSSWPEDEVFLLDYLKTTSKDFKIIIAPHEVNKERINGLQNVFSNAVLYSEISGVNAVDKQVLIIDNIGMLSRIYSQSDIAFIGGGFGKGIHNTLEAAAFGIPVLFGPNYNKFQEAKDLIEVGGSISIKSQVEFNAAINALTSNLSEVQKMGLASKKYVLSKVGATGLIVDWVIKG